MKPSKSPLVNGLRWAAILPAIVATFLILFFLLNLWLSNSKPADAESSNDRSLVSLIAPLIAGMAAAFASISTATWLAPHSHKQVAFWVMILFVILVGYGVFQLINKPFSFRIMQETIGVLIGGVWGYSEAVKKADGLG